MAVMAAPSPWNMEKMRTPVVKREVVSVSNCHEYNMKFTEFFPRVNYEAVPSTCMKCLRERDRQNSKQKRKKRQTRVNTPIIIQLKDTLKAAMQARETQSSCKRNKKYNDLVSQQSKSKSWASGDDKNFSALLSVIEKDHADESKNLQEPEVVDKLQSKDNDEKVLNNVKYSALLPKENNESRKHINVECANVDLICNDLSLSTQGEKCSDNSTEESEFDNSSVVSTGSSVEPLSDSEASVESAASCDFSQDELDRLTDYTTGFPLIRYNCPPAECPQCLASWYSSCQYSQSQSYSDSYYYPPYSPYQPSSSSRYSSSSSSRYNRPRPAPPRRSATVYHTGQYDDDNISVDYESENEMNSLDSDDTDYKDIVEPSIDEYNSHSIRQHSQHEAHHSKFTSHQLLDIGIAKHGNTDEQCLSSVYIDLTGTDVKFSVYYNHDLGKTDKAPAQSDSAPTRSSTYANCSYLYSSSWYPYCYVWPGISCPFILPSIPSPLSLPTTDSSIPRINMVPPSDLHKFTSTHPPQRQWIPLGHPERSRPAAIFTVMCYNVLCDKYCTRQLYGYCPNWALNWEYRKKAILEEIRQYSSDIITLQEVETEQFFNYFLPELKRDGYEGIFSPKSRARTMTEQDRKRVDGCAIFYRTSKFSLVKEHLIEFNQMAMAHAEGSDEMLNRVMTKDNIGLAAILETKEGCFENGVPTEPHQPIMIATAHIHWDPEFSDVKLIQTMMLMWELKSIIEDTPPPPHRPPGSKNDSNSIPMILCGDLNSLPNSGVVEYLSSGNIATNHDDFKELGYELCLQKLNCAENKEILSHQFHLSSACSDDIMTTTNFTFDFKGVIDYIFYSRDYMNCLGMLGPLDEAWFKDNKVLGCPHPHVPSDHFSLFVELEMPIPFPNGRGVGPTGLSKIR